MSVWLGHWRYSSDPSAQFVFVRVAWERQFLLPGFQSSSPGSRFLQCRLNASSAGSTGESRTQVPEMQSEEVLSTRGTTQRSEPERAKELSRVSWWPNPTRFAPANLPVEEQNFKMQARSFKHWKSERKFPEYSAYQMVVKDFVCAGGRTPAFVHLWKQSKATPESASQTNSGYPLHNASSMEEQPNLAQQLLLLLPCVMELWRLHSISSMSYRNKSSANINTHWSCL